MKGGLARNFCNMKVRRLSAAGWVGRPKNESPPPPPPAYPLTKLCGRAFISSRTTGLPSWQACLERPSQPPTFLLFSFLFIWRDAWGCYRGCRWFGAILSRSNIRRECTNGYTAPTGRGPALSVLVRPGLPYPTPLEDPDGIHSNSLRRLQHQSCCDAKKNKIFSCERSPFS